MGKYIRPVCMLAVHLKILIVVRLTGVYGVLPEASQEGMLHPFKSYSDVTLFHFNVPSEVTHATWEFAAFMDNPNCPVKGVHIYLQHGSYPVMSPDNSSFPSSVYTERTSLHYLNTKSAYQPHDATVFSIYNPLPGNWFVAAYITHWDQHVQQEGLGHKCHYSLGSVALWSQVTGIPTVSPGVPKQLTTTSHLSYYKIFIPAGTWTFSLKISNCTFLGRYMQFMTSTRPKYCIKSVALEARSLPLHDPKHAYGNLSGKSEYTYTETEPYTNGFYYLLVVTDSQIKFDIHVVTSECSVQTVKHIFGKFGKFPQWTQSVTVRHSNNSVRSDWVNANLVSNGSDSQKTAQFPVTPKADGLCLPTFQLARIKHAQDFADTFLLQLAQIKHAQDFADIFLTQGREWYTPWIAISDEVPVVLQLEILPFVDIGGTLSIGIHLDELLINTTYQIITVSACIRKGRPPSQTDMEINCNPNLLLTVTSENMSTVDANKLIPYPEPDVWFISFQAKCIYNGSHVPCVLNEVMVSLDARTQPCVFASEPCGLQGVCQETHKGLHFFTSCTCLGGYQGWGCTDDRYAIPHNVLLQTTLLLTLSNVFFIPAIVLALRRQLLTEAFIYMSTMIFSTFYHACDQDFYTYCVTKYEVLQFCDFFCSILAFWVTLIAISGISHKISSTLHMVGVVIIAVGVEYNRTGLFVFIIPVGLGVVIPVAAWSFRRCHQQHKAHCRCSSLLLLPGILLAAIGLVLFAFIETETNYQYVHSAWHVVIALSLVCLLPKKCGGNTQPSSESDISDANDYYSASPVFVVMSDLDQLIPNQT